MRGIFSVVGLLVVLAIVGVLVSKQMSPAGAPQAATPSGAPAAPTGTPQQQVDQVRKAAEAAVQVPRAMPEDSKN